MSVQDDRLGVRILLGGELDASVLWRLEEVIDLVAGAEPSLTIDCSRLTFIDAGGVGALVRAHVLGAMVVGVQGRVRRVLDLVDLAHVLCPLAVAEGPEAIALGTR